MRKLLLATLAAAVSAGFIVSNAAFGVVGPCVNCHTMHNSQHGYYGWAGQTFPTGVNPPYNVWAMTFNNSTTPIEHLLRGNCQYCHTYGIAPKAGTLYYGDHLWPYVDSTTEPYYPRTADNYTTGLYSTANFTQNRALAGGSFYWVHQGNDTCGHNVADLGIAPDANIGLTPPGWDANTTHYTDAIYGTKVAYGEATWTHQLTCAGTYGCHGRHGDSAGDILDSFAGISGAHHSNIYGYVNGTGTLGNSYRFLAGIKGYEQDYYEYTSQPDANGNSHNEYYAVHRTSEDPTTADPHTISYLCAECHGIFHSNVAAYSNVTIGTANGNPWLRHPTDFDLLYASNASAGVDNNTYNEYRYYNGGNGTVSNYSMFAPVGADNVTTVVNTITFDGHHEMVMCISCHRAHGSPYYDILRWDYSSCIANSTSTNSSLMNKCGCMVCHTTKG